MHENDLRDALRHTLTVDAPPPMESSAALAAGRRSVRRRSVRRRYALATTGTAAAMALTFGWGLGPGSALFTADGATQAAGPLSTPSPTITGTARPTATPTGTAWPTGTPSPQHSSATSGHHYEQGSKLLTELRSAIPAGFSPEQGGGSQVMNATTTDGATWKYTTGIVLSKDGRAGRLIAEVRTPGNGLPTDPCALAGEMWPQPGDCQVTTVGGLQVGVKTSAASADVDQWVAYRHPDGTVVLIFQGLSNPGPQNQTPLTALPFTATALATLATDARFHLS